MYPVNPKRLNDSVVNCPKFRPSSKELEMMKAGEYEEILEETELASRINNTSSNNRQMQRPSNLQPINDENKNDAVLMDFSGAFTSGIGAPPPLTRKNGPTKPSSSRPPLGSRPQSTTNRFNKPSTTRPSNKQGSSKNTAPPVKMTRAMELRMKANQQNNRPGVNRSQSRH